MRLLATMPARQARLAKLADARDLKSRVRKDVPVRFRGRAPILPERVCARVSLRNLTDYVRFSARITEFIALKIPGPETVVRVRFPPPAPARVARWCAVAALRLSTVGAPRLGRRARSRPPAPSAYRALVRGRGLRLSTVGAPHLDFRHAPAPGTKRVSRAGARSRHSGARPSALRASVVEHAPAPGTKRVSRAGARSRPQTLDRRRSAPRPSSTIPPRHEARIARWCAVTALRRSIVDHVLTIGVRLARAARSQRLTRVEL